MSPARCADYLVNQAPGEIKAIRRYFDGFDRAIKKTHRGVTAVYYKGFDLNQLHRS